MQINNVANPGDTIQFNFFGMPKNYPGKRGYGKVVCLEVFNENLISYVVTSGKRELFNVPKTCIVRVWPKGK